ncbi:MAG: leucine-rich repeat domain-containing protein, partial [Bacteroides sp.]|nr:leucine-rich repeat domain-containing protein [Bacteroides sp.]
DETIYAAYPALHISDEMAVLEGTYYWPDEKPMPFAYAIGKVADGKLNLSFNHVYAYIKLTLNAETVAASNIKEITDLWITNPSGTPIALAAGRFDFSSQSIVEEKGIDYLSYKLKEPFIATGTAEKSIYIPILPQPAGETINLSVLHTTQAGVDTLFTVSKEVPSTGFVAGRAYTYSPKSSITRVGNTVTLTEAGTLSQVISAAEKDTITSLKIIGPLNGDDIRFIREMAGSDVRGNATEGKLVDLDISEATIVEGGDMYYNDTNLRECYTGNDVLGNFMFSYTKLQRILPPVNITSIGNSAFRFCESLTDVVIPETVTSLGDYAFSFCIKLTDINLPEAITSIGFEAFSACNLLNNIIIPEAVTTIGDYAFSDCHTFTKIIIPDNVTSIGAFTFQRCYNMTEVAIGNGVMSIGNSAFRGCFALQTIVIPDGVTLIDNSAFEECSELSNVEFSDGLVSIGNSAFKNCTVESITLPNSLTSIGNDAFGYCESLSEVTCNATTPPSLGSSVFIASPATLYVPSGTYNAYMASDWAQYFTTIDDGEDHGSYENGVATVITAGTLSSLIPEDEKYTITTLKVVGSLNGDDIRFIREMAGRDVNGNETEGRLVDLDLSEASIVEGGGGYIMDSLGIEYYYTSNNKVGYSMFSQTILKNISLPQNVTSIDISAFSGCSALTSINIPDGVTFIDNNAFYNCFSLSSINIPDSVTEIRDAVFLGCSSLTSIDIPDGVTSIADHAFLGCSSLTSVDIPNSVTSIGERAFENCSSLISIEIPDGVTSIGWRTFDGCSNLTSVMIGAGVTSIGESAFYGCSSLSLINIPDGITSIGNSAFAHCTSLSEVTCNAANPPTLEGDAFYYISSPSTLIVPTGCTFAYSESDWASYFTTIEEATR